MAVKIFQVDAFTTEPFRGNPAAVCLLQDPTPDSWMQSVAAEMNLSETAFLVREGAPFSIRYFTPTVEVPICGHATLASAHVLWEERRVGQKEERITFRARGGTFHADREGDWIRLDFPVLPAEPAEIPPGLVQALGVKPVAVSCVAKTGHLVELESEKVVCELTPDLAVLREQEFGPVSITARSSSKSYDFVSRFFWPAGGIDEDPVTGAAHCSLGPYWAERLGKNDLVGCQASRRGGIVRVRVRGERVDLLGQAITVMRGEMVI